MVLSFSAMLPRPRRCAGYAFLALTALIAPANVSAVEFGQYTLRRTGFTGVDYVRSADGNGYSFIESVNEAGHVVGVSERYIEGTSYVSGFHAWIDTGNGPVQLGLRGSGYQRSPFGSGIVRVSSLNEAGQVIGSSRRYDGSLNTGQASWIDDGTGPLRLGFTGSGYQRSSDGYEYSTARMLNDAGQVIGESRRYNGTAEIGRTVWIDDGTGPIKLGFTGNGYQRTSDGYEDSFVYSLNEAGQAVGYSLRYDGTTSTGRVAWIDDGTGPVRLGFTGSGYQRSSDGYESSSARLLNEVGHIAGSSSRYDGTTLTGQVAWIDHGTGPVQLGLTGSGYQRSSDGYESSSAHLLNEAGQVAGYSNRYDQTTDTGRAVWIDDGTGAVRIGLSGNEFQRSSDGREFSLIQFLNEAGQVVGSSYRFTGSSNNGRGAWIGDNTGTVQLGFTGNGYQRSSDGYAYSNAVALNEAGQAVGVSNRYDGDLSNGVSGWFYDSLTGNTSELLFSTDSSGYGYTYIDALTEDGTVLGSYNLYADDDTFENRLFGWNLEDGLTDLSDLIVNLEEDGGAERYSIAGINGDGTIMGMGDLLMQYGETESIFAFILSPIAAPSLAGDYNGDGFVSQADLDLVLLNWGDTVLPDGFDADAIADGGPFDGLVSQNELDAVLLNWGEGTAPDFNAIPEPATGGVLGVIGLAGLSRHRLGRR